MKNLVGDSLSVETTGDFDFVDYIPGDDLDHPVHSAVVMAWNRYVGPVLELVHSNGSDPGPSFCKYAVVIDPAEAAGFPKNMAIRMPIGFKVNVSLKYGPIYDPDGVTFPAIDPWSPRYLKQLHQLVKGDRVLIGSLAWADQPADCWEEVESSFATGSVVSVRVVDVGFNRDSQKGGLVVQCGLLRGFVPAGLVDFRSKFYGLTLEQILRSMVGQTIKVKAIRVDRQEKQLIFSEAAAQDEIRRSQKAKFLADVRIGDQLMGFVTNIQPSLGIFVRVGECCDGLVRPDNLIGDTPELHQPVTVEVISANLARGHLNLKLDTTPVFAISEADFAIEEEFDLAGIAVSASDFEIEGEDTFQIEEEEFRIEEEGDEFKLDEFEIEEES